MRIRVNGRWESLDAPCPLSELLARLGLGSAHCAVAVNREFVPRSLHGATTLSDGDEVEILSARQGG